MIGSTPGRRDTMDSDCPSKAAPRPRFTRCGASDQPATSPYDILSDMPGFIGTTMPSSPSTRIRPAHCPDTVPAQKVTSRISNAPAMFSTWPGASCHTVYAPHRPAAGSPKPTMKLMIRNASDAA